MESPLSIESFRTQRLLPYAEINKTTTDAQRYGADVPAFPHCDFDSVQQLLLVNVESTKYKTSGVKSSANLPHLGDASLSLLVPAH